MNAQDIQHIISNAKRLLDDAKLLNEQGRYPTAYALAVLGIEELGKALLKSWDIPDHKRRGYSHLMKQRAVASLLLGQLVEKEFGHEIGAGSQSNEDLVTRVAKALSESKQGKFRRQVESTAIEKMKQMALYHDGWWVTGLNQEDFGQDSVEDVFVKCAWVLEAALEQKWLWLGRGVFELTRLRTKARTEKRPDA